METKLMNAFYYYVDKTKDAEAQVIVFRTKNDYKIYCSDKKYIEDVQNKCGAICNKIDQEPLGVLSILFKNDAICVKTLACKGKSVHVVKYRNAKREYDVPNIEQMEKEKMLDY